MVASTSLLSQIANLLPPSERGGEEIRRQALESAARALQASDPSLSAGVARLIVETLVPILPNPPTAKAS